MTPNYNDGHVGTSLLQAETVVCNALEQSGKLEQPLGDEGALQVYGKYIVLCSCLYICLCNVVSLRENIPLNLVPAFHQELHLDGMFRLTVSAPVEIHYNYKSIYKLLLTKPSCHLDCIIFVRYTVSFFCIVNM